MSSKRDIICRDLHALEPTDIQAFIDRLSIVERHRVCRALNSLENGPYEITTSIYDAYCKWPDRSDNPELNLCLFLADYVSTGHAGRKETER
jgi:hypothetical protein